VTSNLQSWLTFATSILHFCFACDSAPCIRKVKHEFGYKTARLRTPPDADGAKSLAAAMQSCKMLRAFRYNDIYAACFANTGVKGACAAAAPLGDKRKRPLFSIVDGIKNLNKCYKKCCCCCRTQHNNLK
jgi:hypothetical protein